MAYKRSRAAFEADLQIQQSPFVSYGTPLPPLDEEVRDDGSFVPVWQQEVRDEQGRKRLHGAFTGGFSAGYFNTVGSKEGWAPSTFVSSRSNKRKNDETKQQRPEDFMDEEDLAAMAESKQLQTDQSYAGFGSTAEDGKRQGMIMDLLRPEGETMGVKLLQKMGWRQGQGVGARVRRTAQLDVSGDTSAESHLFAPENTRMISFNRKNDRKGLGYSGESKPLPSRTTTQDENEDTAEDEESSVFSISAKSKAKSKPKTKRTGFGTGVLNDDSDGEDPYALGPSISYNRVIGGEKKKKKAPAPSAKTTANPLLGSRPIFRSQKILQSQPTFRKCHDGRFPITGFSLSGTIDASAALSSDVMDKYPMPKIPEGWKSEKIPSTASIDPSTYQTIGEAAKLSTHDSKSRAAVLGEAQLPGKSVFDFLSKSARDRLSTASGRNDLPTARGESIPSLPSSFSSSTQQHNTISGPLLPDDPSLPGLDKSTALAALGRGINGWMPYADDTAKRARYTAFLSLQGGLAESLPPPPAADKLPRDAWIQELREFAHAANVFKPMTGAMASRFTTASASGSAAASAGPSAGSKGGDDTTKPLLQTPNSASSIKKEDPAEEAGRLGMFGPLTRSTAVFYPTRLVCKRFNIRPPAHVQVGGDGGESGEGREGQGREEAKARVPDLVSKEAVERMMREHAVARGGGAYAQSAGEGSKDGNKGATPAAETRALAIEWGESKVDMERNEALEGEKAGDAVFRAVFGDGESSDDE